MRKKSNKGFRVKSLFESAGKQTAKCLPLSWIMIKIVPCTRVHCFMSLAFLDIIKVVKQSQLSFYSARRVSYLSPLQRQRLFRTRHSCISNTSNIWLRLPSLASNLNTHVARRTFVNEWLRRYMTTRFSFDHCDVNTDYLYFVVLITSLSWSASSHIFAFQHICFSHYQVLHRIIFCEEITFINNFNNQTTS